jgi:uncharacterized membrane protein YeaQ/YmgE (transglycosylase-associated protein family)
MSLIYSIIISGLVGFLTGLIRKGSGYGFFANILVGIVGGFVGNFVAGLFGIDDVNNLIGKILISVVGALIFLGILNLLGNKSI